MLVILDSVSLNSNLDTSLFFFFFFTKTCPCFEVIKNAKTGKQLLDFMACTWLHLADLTQQFRSSLPRPPPSSLVCSEIMAVHSDSIDSAHPMRFLRSLTCRSMESPSSLRSVKSESAGHRHRSLWLLRERHARTVLAERRRGEDLHEAECERLVARRSERQGGLVSIYVRGNGWINSNPALHPAPETSAKGWTEACTASWVNWSV